MPLQDLPLEILLEIARLHPWVGYELSHTVRKVGLYSLENDTKRWFKVEENDETFILVKSSKEPYYRKLHHSWDDNPAVMWSSGYKEWYKNGMTHRGNDKPAVIWSNGTKMWYKNGKLHRDDDPAAIFSRCFQKWYKKGKHYHPFLGIIKGAKLRYLRLLGFLVLLFTTFFFLLRL